MAVRGTIGENYPTLGYSVGAGLGQGLSAALQGLAQHKLEQIQHEKGIHRAAKGFEPLLGSKEAALAVASLPPELQKVALQNPEALRSLFGGQREFQPQTQSEQSVLSKLENLGVQEGPTPEQQQYLAQLANPLLRRQQPAFGQQQMQPQEQMFQQEAQRQLQPQQPQNQQAQIDRAQQIADLFTSPQEKRAREELELKRQKAAREERREEREMTAAEKEKNRSLIDVRKNLKDYVRTAEELKKHVKNASFNPATSYLAENPHLRGQLDKESSAFDTEATHLFNLGAQLIKGPVSIQRLKGLAREKASLGKSKEENERYINDSIKAAKQQLQIFDKEYPEIAQKYNEEPEEEQSAYKGYDAYQENGKYYLWDKAANEYRPAKLKGK